MHTGDSVQGAQERLKRNEGKVADIPLVVEVFCVPCTLGPGMAAEPSVQIQNKGAAWILLLFMTRVTKDKIVFTQIRPLHTMCEELRLPLEVPITTQFLNWRALPVKPNSRNTLHIDAFSSALSSTKSLNGFPGAWPAIQRSLARGADWWCFLYELTMEEPPLLRLVLRGSWQFPMVRLGQEADLVVPRCAGVIVKTKTGCRLGRFNASEGFWGSKGWKC